MFAKPIFEDTDELQAPDRTPMSAEHPGVDPGLGHQQLLRLGALVTLRMQSEELTDPHEIAAAEQEIEDGLIAIAQKLYPEHAA